MDVSVFSEWINKQADILYKGLEHSYEIELVTIILYVGIAPLTSNPRHCESPLHALINH